MWGTNTLYDWWRGERTIQIISHGEVVRLYPHIEEIYCGSWTHVTVGDFFFWVVSLWNGEIVFIFSNGKTDRRRNKCHLLSQKTLFLFSFNLNFLSWPDAFEESFQVRNTKFLTVPHSNVTLMKNAVQRIFGNISTELI